MIMINEEPSLTTPSRHRPNIYHDAHRTRPRLANPHTIHESGDHRKRLAAHRAAHASEIDDDTRRTAQYEILELNGAVSGHCYAENAVNHIEL
jgi:hypothetical protein